MTPYTFTPGNLPLLVSIPHAGTQLPPELQGTLTAEAASLPDTDWHLPVLYDFVKEMGASLLMGHYSRFAIDLNRPLDDQPLYTTATTGLFPETLFNGEPVFQPGKTPTDNLRQRYKQEIWQPYHQQLEQELERLTAKFGYVVLYDAHSIASVIPRLFEGRLPDINIGTHDGKSCAPAYADAITQICAAQEKFTWVVNGRFKGGYITRHYGDPARQRHAIQIELAQVNYMAEQPPFDLDMQKAPALQSLLRQFLTDISVR